MNSKNKVSVYELREGKLSHWSFGHVAKHPFYRALGNSHLVK